jgi:hypothetical protein
VTGRRALWLMALAAAPALPARWAVAQGPADLQGAVNGLYPLWEQTAVLHPAGGGQVGYSNAQVGLGAVQIGTQPFLDLYGTFNLQLKAALFEGEHHRLAVVLGGYRVPAESGTPELIDLRLPAPASPDRVLTLLPLSVAHSYASGDRLRVHSSITGLFRYASDPADRRPSLGLATMLAWRTSWHWSARLHGGVWGLGLDPQAHAGLSVAYWSERVSLAAGYARQAAPSGLNEGVLMFDGALLFH